MANFLAPIINDQQEDSNGAPLSGGTIEVYLAGSSTPVTTYSDQAGANPNTWPIVLNTLGVNSQGAVWLGGGFAYKFIIKDSTGVVQRTIDNVQGINDSTSTLDQWVQFQTAPTYVSATSFTVAGDQRQIFQIRRRIKSTNTGGIIYSTVTNSTYVAPNTTVTVANDSGVLDSGLSQVFYGIISPLNTSLPGGLLIGTQIFTANGTYTPTAGTLSIIVELVGGGGGGGGTTATGASAVSAGGGGGGGGYCRSRLTTGFSGAAVVVGAGGSFAAGAAGNAGAASTFLTMSAGGGGGGGLGPAGGAIVSSSGAGGVATGGNLINADGQYGGEGGGTFAGNIGFSGMGGFSLLGCGGKELVLNGTIGVTWGFPGSGRGGGGSGGRAGQSQVAGAGGAGSNGICIIYEYA